MNPRWLKQNLVTIIFLVGVALLIGVTVYFERQAAASKQQIEEELGDQQRRLAQIRGGNPAPTPENLQSLKQDREQLQQLYMSLQEAIGHSTIETPKMKDEIEFGQTLRSTITRLQDLTARNHVTTPDAFAFGFSRYGPMNPFPCRNPPSKPEECQRLLALLTKQLFVVEKLTELAVDSGVEVITSIRRPEVEPTGGTGGGVDTLAASIEHDPKALHYTYPFELQFACGAKALQRFLDALAKSDWFFAVKSLRIDTETLTTSAQTITSVPGRAGTTFAPGVPTEKAPEIKRLLVTAHIDLIEFPGPETKPETGSDQNLARGN
jgi:hypothetical protein